MFRDLLSQAGLQTDCILLHRGTGTRDDRSQSDQEARNRFHQFILAEQTRPPNTQR